MNRSSPTTNIWLSERPDKPIPLCRRLGGFDFKGCVMTITMIGQQWKALWLTGMYWTRGMNNSFSFSKADYHE